MKDRKRHVARMRLQSLHATLTDIVPYFYRTVVRGSDKVGLVRTRVEFDIIDACVMCIHREIRCGRSEGPHFHGSIEAGGGEGVGIFGVEGEVHDVVRVPLEDLSEFRQLLT